LVEDNEELEAWFRKSDGGKEVEQKTFTVMGEIVLALVRARGK
jgi:hypothetical protein